MQLLPRKRKSAVKNGTINETSNKRNSRMRITNSENGALRCPKCLQTDLVEAHSDVRNFHPEPGVFRCENCSGHWVDSEPIESYLAKQYQAKAEAFRSVWLSNPQSGSALKCPRDQNQFGIINYSAIDLDICPCCKGLWFDALELEVITSEHASMKGGADEIVRRSQKVHDSIVSDFWWIIFTPSL